MDLSEIPFDMPVVIHSLRNGKNLQNPLGSKKALCFTNNRDAYEQLMLRHVRDDKVAIQSVSNGRFLQVRASGESVFDPKEPGEWELFTMETDSACALYFVSCHTGNVLQCDEDNVARCANQNRQDWEAWRILEPRTTAGTNQLQRGSDRRFVHEGKERRDFILELARCGKTPDEIEKIVRMLQQRVTLHAPLWQFRSIRSRSDAFLSELSRLLHLDQVPVGQTLSEPCLRCRRELAS